MKTNSCLSYLSHLIRRNTLRTIQAAQTGHLGACCSSNELFTVLYFSGLLGYDETDPRHPDRDYVLVRGHLGPLRYNIFAHIGWLDPEEMTTYRAFGSRLHGHEDMHATPGVDLTPSGSLGMLLSYAVGAALSFRRRGKDNYVWCFLGDGEEQEGNVSEATRHASSLGAQISRLIVVIDHNGKQLSTSTRTTDGGCHLERLWTAYGWKVIVLRDGHDVGDVHRALSTAKAMSDSTLVCVIAHTVKGHGIAGALDHYTGYHVYHRNNSGTPTQDIDLGSAVTNAQQRMDRCHIERDALVRYEQATFRRSLPRAVPDPDPVIPVVPVPAPPSDTPPRTSYACLHDYLRRFVPANSHRRIYVVTADYPPRDMVYDTGKFFLQYDHLLYLNVGIREQHLVAMVHGLQTVDPASIVIVLCGDAFLYRCADQIHVLAQSSDRVVFYSVQAGLSGAQNGFTHQTTGIAGCLWSMGSGVEVYEPATQADWWFAMNDALSWSSRSCVKYIRTHASPAIVSLPSSVVAPLSALPVGRDSALTLVTCGMVAEDVYRAATRLWNIKEMGSTVVNIVQLSRLEGIGKWVSPASPLVFVFNGNPAILSSIVTRQCALEGVFPLSVHEFGFERGTTGRMDDLKRWTRLDEDGLYERFVAVLHARRPVHSFFHFVLVFFLGLIIRFVFRSS